MNMTDIALQAKGISKSFGGLEVVKDFEVGIRKNEITALIGPNGAGKTTLFNIITGYLRPDSGVVKAGEKVLTDLEPFEIARLGVARTFQGLRLLQQAQVLEIILLAVTPPAEEKFWVPFLRAYKSKALEKQHRERAHGLLEVVKLQGKVKSLGSELSYGQQKLLTIACALATEPEILLFDEPVSGLQPSFVEQISNMIKEFPDQGKTVVFIEHNLDAVTELADTVIVMDEGRKIAEGPPSILQTDSEVIEAYWGHGEDGFADNQ